jgi:hypothetical protein
MQLTRLVLFGAAGGALVVWAAAAATSSPASPSATARRPVVGDVRGAQLQSEIARLHERLRPDAAPVQQRDLFHFEARSGLALRAAAPVAIVPIEPAPVAAAAPPLKLIGLAEEPGANGAVRTAIISGQGELFMAKEGDRVADRFHVVRISADGVELSDDQGTVPLRLRLP